MASLLGVYSVKSHTFLFNTLFCPNTTSTYAHWKVAHPDQWKNVHHCKDGEVAALAASLSEKAAAFEIILISWADFTARGGFSQEI